jgi:aminoglycoside phosphotransferase (APT) family kinase protein
VTQVLDRARTMSYHVGANPRRGAAGALWALALPSLELDAVLRVGKPRAVDLEVVTGLAAQLMGVDEPAGTDSLGPALRSLSHRSLDLIWIAGNGASTLPERDAVLHLLSERLAPGGHLYLEHRGLLDANLFSGLAPSLHLNRLLLAPLAGPTRSLVPADDETTIELLAAGGHLTGDGRPPGRRLIEPRLLASKRLRRSIARFGHVLSKAEAAEPGPPAYIRAIAQADGIDLCNRRWALLAPGDYATQKILMPIYDDAGRAEMMVKITPDPANTARLLNEADALQRLARLPLRARGTVPSVRFSGTHAGRAVVGETWVEGKPLRTRAEASSACPVLHAASDWLADLASVSVEHRPATEMAVALRELFDRFVEVHRPPETDARFLAGQIERVARHEGKLPVVLQHGDPGSWNMLVTDDGSVAILDWESYEPAGAPLWDLLYFLRSYGTLVSRRSGARNRLQAAARHFLEPTPLQSYIVDRIHRSARELSLPSALIEPLFYACWMHRALKEATRMSSETLAHAHYGRLLHHFVDRRNEAPLRRLFNTEATP